ncbi:hypothetical protein MCW82_25410, partial [Azospirillum doebereinerae]|uniref:hypothetical protein n=1 Tax=Azospirillum doebereinerae TaxID=92933 RepID=UPI001EE57734
MGGMSRDTPVMAFKKQTLCVLSVAEQDGHREMPSQFESINLHRYSFIKNVEHPAAGGGRRAAGGGR